MFFKIKDSFDFASMTVSRYTRYDKHNVADI